MTSIISRETSENVKHFSSEYYLVVNFSPLSDTAHDAPWRERVFHYLVGEAATGRKICAGM